jgi:hypothetical protein
MTYAFKRLLDRQEILELIFRRAIQSSDGLFLRLDQSTGDRKRESASSISYTIEVTNVLCDFPAEDVAFVESYFVAWPQTREKNGQTIGGRFLDRMERQENRWVIADTDVVYDWSDCGLRNVVAPAGGLPFSD